MKIVLLGTGLARPTRPHAERPDIDEVVVFGRSPQS
jgi:hypothetical protein